MRIKYIGQMIVSMFSVALTLCMTACDRSISNELMSGASPDTSALVLYTYDGDTVSRTFIFDSDAVKGILDKLDAVEAVESENWSLDDITLPIYGLEIGSMDGTTISTAWTNGYWITQDGAIYRYDYDFAELAQDDLWTDNTEFPSFAVFPCARILTQDESGWNRTLLTPIPELTPPSGVTMTLKSWEENAVNVSIANESGTEWTYGEYYNLHVLLDGVWYDVSPVPGNWGFNDIGYMMQEGETNDITYYLTMYGALPAGTYRLTVEDLSVQQAIA